AVADAVLLNCLDPIYGHAVLRLLNASRDLQHVVVVVPKALEVLVPTEVSGVWVVDEPLGRLSGWLVDFERQALHELDRFDTCELSPAFPHPSPDTWDLSTFARSRSRRHGDPSIVLSFRADRLWGRTLGDQESNVAELCERLRAAYPEAGIVLIGP